MRYHYEPEADRGLEVYGQLYFCNHPVYNRCTLFLVEDKGLAVIRQYFSQKDKSTYWREIGRTLAKDIYLNPNFQEFFKKRAKPCKDGLYPTVSVRQIMWALRMKPLPKMRWETVFDRKDI